jgi:hypothetical protein
VVKDTRAEHIVVAGRLGMIPNSRTGILLEVGALLNCSTENVLQTGLEAGGT